MKNSAPKTSSADVSAPRPAKATLRMLVLPQINSWMLIPGLMFGLVLSAGIMLKLFSGRVPPEMMIDQTLSNGHNGLLTFIAASLGTLFSPLGGALLLGAVCLYLLIISRSPVNALGVGAIASIGWLSAEILKFLVARPRPDAALLADPLVTENGLDSFPSGYVSLGVGIAFALSYLAYKTSWWKPALLGGILLVVALAWSRLYLGAHYPSDVLAAMINASAFIFFFTGLWNRYTTKLIARLRFLSVFGPLPEPQKSA